MSRMQPQLRQYLTQLRQQAYVDIRSGYLDSAATGDSVKPLYSAYTPPAPKKKAKLQRTRYRTTGRTYRSKSKTAAPATATGATAAGATTQQAATTSPLAAQKPGKKEKVRYGQAPREALPPAATPTVQAQEGAQAGTAVGAGDPNAATPAAGAATDGSEVARNVAPDISTNADVPTTAAPATKTRFADRARQPKPKKVKSADQVETENLEKVPTDEVEAQKTQSAPLGLAGDTLHPKKVKTTKGEKTRYADNAGKKAEPPPPPPSSTPSPLASPGTAAPQENAPATPPADSGPPATQPAPTQQPQPSQQPQP
jgi:peptidyl-prolyl cis-trans isomerase SurA